MANTFLNLPLPVGNGPGAAVNTAQMGEVKSVIVGGTFPGATIRLEASNDGGNTWGPVLTFQKEGKLVVHLAAEFLRVFVSGRQATLPFSANVDVGANDDGGVFLVLPLPAGNGAGPAVATNGLGTFKTVIASGVMDGASVTAEISEDGISWEPLGESFYNVGGVQSNEGAADFMRVVVSGRQPNVPFSAVVAVGAINDPGSLWSGLNVDDEGILVGTRQTLNFIGAGVTAVDNPGQNRVDVTIPGADLDTTLLTWGNANVGAAADTRFLSPGRDNSAIALVANVAEVVMPRAGTVRRLYVRHNSAFGNGNPVVYTVMKNGVATGITVSLATGAVGQVADLINTVAVVAGDRLSIQLSKAAVIGGANVDAQASLEIGN